MTSLDGNVFLTSLRDDFGTVELLYKDRDEFDHLMRILGLVH